MTEIYTHVKTGGQYHILCEASLESDLTLVVVYRNVSNGLTWVRPKGEFFDGRFIIPKFPSASRDQSNDQ